MPARHKRPVRRGADERLIARSGAMRRLLQEVRRYAAADANVLITGETGAGKDRVAHALHDASPRRSHPFIKIDCAGMPASLMEAELFGFERGAFTDASAAKAGRFELAGAGTVYLDGVGELPLDLQGKLLRAVEDKRVERLGGVAVIEVKARIVSSSADGIERAVQQGAFRDDLFHRLRVLPLHVPPLRERKADVLPLARGYLKAACAAAGSDPMRLTREAQGLLLRYRWPGNVRELKHVVERAVLDADPARGVIDAADLPIDLLADPASYMGSGPDDRPTLEELERRYIALVLRETRGRQTDAARRLGISRKALWEKRKRYKLE
ncbi:MAG: sigma-54-dependent Fis family transcriptional regulator [Acidobacteria bacterium]|nr:sigma-54-dependent Fis family transcriptional regulator [Acidobacteriota bacterium]